jgi:hypothetical protein
VRGSRLPSDFKQTISEARKVPANVGPDFQIELWLREPDACAGETVATTSAA